MAVAEHHTDFPDPAEVSRKSINQDTICAVAEKVILNWNSGLTIFIDGSAMDSCRQGGAAVSSMTPLYETILAKGAAFTSSFE